MYRKKSWINLLDIYHEFLSWPLVVLTGDFFKMLLVISKQKLFEVISLESVKKVKLQETREPNVSRFFF